MGKAAMLWSVNTCRLGVLLANCHTKGQTPQLLYKGSEMHTWKL